MKPRDFFLVFVLVRLSRSFRVIGNNSDDPILPYETGFVGYYGEPTNYLRERVNEGAPNTPEFPRQFEYESIRRELSLFVC